MYNRIEHAWARCAAMNLTHVRYVAGVVALCTSGFLAACSERTTSPLHPSTRQGERATDLGRAADASAAADRATGPRIKSRKFHFRDHTGHLNSIAIVDGSDARHPTAAYQFVDAKIRVVARFTYDLGGRPSTIVYTVFDEHETPKVQVTQTVSTRTASAAGTPREPSSVSTLASRFASVVQEAILPTPLHAQANCLPEAATLSEAAEQVAAATLAVTTCEASASCAPMMEGLLQALAWATADWNTALNALNACESGVTAGGGAGSGGSAGGGGGGIDGAIDQFINDPSTTESCDASGNDCIYTQNAT